MNNFLKAVISIAIPQAVGAVAGFLTASSVQGWFSTIIKPSFNPPNWVFAPAWTTLYLLMGIAFFLIWKLPASPLRKKAMIIYFIQLTLNFLWSFGFFYLHKPGLALINIAALWVMIIITMIAFGKLSKTAAWLLLPYLLWVSFATALNFSIWQLNP